MKKNTRYLIAIIMIPFFFSCTKETSTAAPDETGSTDTRKPDLEYNVNKTLMLGLVNEARAQGCKCGTTDMPPVPALTWNDLLAKAAYNHSNDMKRNKYFSHTNMEGQSPGDRIKSVGYNWKTYGENIAQGQITEQIVMNSWLQSEGHCKNIMNKNFKDIGVGRSGNYWTQVFGAK